MEKFLATLTKTISSVSLRIYTGKHGMNLLLGNWQWLGQCSTGLGIINSQTLSVKL